MTEITEKPVRRSQGYRSFSSNTATLITADFDVRLVFGDICPDETGQLVNEQMASVMLSWEHAKALANVLEENIREHEENFGPLFLEQKPGESSDPTTGEKRR